LDGKKDGICKNKLVILRGKSLRLKVSKNLKIAWDDLKLDF